jgi:hypothetical protein
MTLTEMYAKYNEMPPTKRRLLLIMPAAAVFMFALITAPHGQSSVRDAATVNAAVVSDCAATKMSMSIFGRSLMAYDWQSGNCTAAAARPRKPIE